MTQITFNKKKYDLPTSWDEVKLEMIIKTSELSDLLPDAPLVAIMAGYSGIPVDELKPAKMAQVGKIMEALEFIYEEYKPLPSNHFVHNGIQYGCEDDIINIEFQDYVSLQTILYNYRDNPVKGLPYMIAALFKKDNEKLDDFNLDDRAKEFLTLKFTTAKNLECFFLHSKSAYETIIQLSLIQDQLPELVLHKITELQNIIKKHKEQNGGSLLTKLVIGVLQIYLKRLKRGLEKYYNTTLTRHSKMN